MLNRGRPILAVSLTALAVGLLCFSLPGLAKPPPRPGPAYSLAELKVPQGFAASYPAAVNDLGQVVGDIASGGRHAAVWKTTSATATDLDNGYGASRARAINNLGQIVGSCSRGAMGWPPVIWVPGAVGYDMTDLTRYPDDGYASDINNQGYVVGYLQNQADFSEAAFVIRPEDTNGDKVPDTWFRDDDNDGVNDLMLELRVFHDEWGWWYVEPSAINDSGWVVGVCDPGWAYPGWEAFLIIPDFELANPWFKDDDGDGTNDLAIILPDGWWAYDVNNQGQIVGDGGKYVWDVDVADDGTVTVTQTQLPPPTTSYRWSIAWSINDSGHVVGVGRPSKGANPDYEPFLWQKDKGTRLLESLSNMAGFSDLGAAVGINNHGQIVGSGTTRAGVRGYVATPVAP